MNHDITMCSGEGCSKRDTCHRYKAFRTLRGDEEYPISFCSAVECIKENYNLFWEDKE